MKSYLPEQFDPRERVMLAPYVTDVDAQVFGLRNLDVEVAAALFARYSRSARSLRRTLLEEFVGDLGPARPSSEQARTRALLDRVIGEYGDDSVAQLGVVHVAIEQVPALLARRIERGRLASYLEQSTRYVLLGRRRDGTWPMYVPEGLSPTTRHLYDDAVERSFQAYDAVRSATLSLLASRDGGEEEALRRAQRAAALDAARGLLPLGVLTNVGVVASAQAAERLVWRLRADTTPGAHDVAEQLARVLHELVPGLTQRMDRPDRGGAMVAYLGKTRAHAEPPWSWNVTLAEPRVRLRRWDPDAEAVVGAWILVERGDAPTLDVARAMLDRSGPAALDALFHSYVGERSNRRHLPGRALEAATYHVEVECDVGAYRDLARHRLLTLIEPPIAPGLGFSVAPLVEEAGLWPFVARHLEDLGRLVEEVRELAGAGVARLLLPFATQVRFGLVVNARELMHLLELRSQPQGHPTYRQVALALWRAVGEVGHRRIADAMSFVDAGGYTVGRLEAERRYEARSQVRGKDQLP